MICRKCGASIPVEEIRKADGVVKCPFCKQTQEVNESDAVKIERIRANKFKDTEIGKHKIEKDAEVAEKYIELEEKKVGLRKTKVVLVFLIIVAIAAIAAWRVITNSHSGKIKVSEDASFYTQQEYDSVSKNFQSAGFDNIQFDVQQTLSKKDKEDENLVTQVSISGDTSFKAGTWFAKDAPVIITYRVLDPDKANEVQIPESAVHFEDLDYVKVCEDLQDAGFENIVLCPKYDVKFYEGSKNGVIQSITIGSNSEFSKGDWVPYNSKIRVTYRTKKLDYEGENYEDIEKKLESIGFADVICVPLNDLRSSDDKKMEKVKSILIDDTEFSDADTLNMFSKVFIKYHSEKQADNSQIKITEAAKKFKGEEYQDVVAMLEKMGFSNIETAPLGDLKKGILHKEGHVKEVSIDGNTKFKEGEIFSKDAIVIVSYHSYPN